MLKPLFVFTTLFLVGAGAQASTDSRVDYKSAFQCEGKEKFNWYCEEEVALPPIIEKKPEPAPPKEAPPAEVKAPEISEFARIQARLQELLQIAYVNPSEENIYNYIQFQNDVTTKAAVFADNWKRVQWVNPELDYSQKFPTAQMAKAVNNRTNIQKQDSNLESLKEQGYGLFFFYRSDCDYCHQMEFPVKLLAERSKMDVMSISVDGVLVDKFPNSQVDTGQAANLGVTQTPTIMLINTKTKDIQPIATGWVSVQELEKRIYVLTATKPGDNF
ncbi:conjugal transfer protein TraF [Thiomicrorhabdus aquaedulcis]|uniref:conjugal transfer protein TraF n=1 Tax=Thiomicrorhabdus aquaedulcis TaxID=2211106 RepID=UPI000FD7A21F|nr:conjugal transfer protein TraF [Thiomicrorhabdus aquaedulcis]